MIRTVLCFMAAPIVIVLVERGQRRITVNYAKRQQGRSIDAFARPIPRRFIVFDRALAG